MTADLAWSTSDKADAHADLQKLSQLNYIASPEPIVRVGTIVLKVFKTDLKPYVPFKDPPSLFSLVDESIMFLLTLMHCEELGGSAQEKDDILQSLAHTKSNRLGALHPRDSATNTTSIASNRSKAPAVTSLEGSSSSSAPQEDKEVGAENASFMALLSKPLHGSPSTSSASVTRIMELLRQGSAPPINATSDSTVLFSLLARIGLHVNLAVQWSMEEHALLYKRLGALIEADGQAPSEETRKKKATSEGLFLSPASSLSRIQDLVVMSMPESIQSSLQSVDHGVAVASGRWTLPIASFRQELASLPSTSREAVTDLHIERFKRNIDLFLHPSWTEDLIKTVKSDGWMFLISYWRTKYLELLA